MVPVFSENANDLLLLSLWSFFHCLKLDVWEEFQDCTGGRDGCFGWVCSCVPCLIWWDHLSMKAKEGDLVTLALNPLVSVQRDAPPAHSVLRWAWGSIHDNLSSLELKVKIKGSKTRLKSKCSKPEKAAPPPSWLPMRQRPRSKDVVPSAD